MLAIYFDGAPEVKELPLPDPAPGEVLIRVSLAGICGTDGQILQGYHHFRGVLGHEFVGVVAGPADSPWLGRRVVGEINIACGACDLCQEGQPRHCRDRRVLGINRHDGAFAQYLTLPVANLHPVPPEVPDEAAVFTEPLAAALQVTESGRLSPGDRTLVVGDGPLGLLISWVLALHGVQVSLAGHHPEHLALARPYGVETFLEKHLPAGDYPVVVEVSGSPGGLELALSRVRPQGLVILKSTYVERFLLDPAALVVPEVRLVGSRCGPFPAALRLLRQGWLDPRPLITQTFPLSLGLTALEWARRPGVLKVLLDCH